MHGVSAVIPILGETDVLARDVSIVPGTLVPAFEFYFPPPIMAGHIVTCIVDLRLRCEGIFIYYSPGRYLVTAKKKKEITNEYIYACMYVRVTLILQHVSLMILQGMLMPFLVVPTAVEAVSATLAYCPDGMRETGQIGRL